ncbi:MAG: flagellar filament capping protein FliD, partial [Bacteroidetes bacterium]|nr:flagellar filament capping protein FliD [Bacteroidota bacterium]
KKKLGQSSKSVETFGSKMKRISGTIGRNWINISTAVRDAARVIRAAVRVVADFANAAAAEQENINNLTASLASQGIAYNDVKAFLNEQSQVNSSTGEAAADAGVLFGSSTLLGITSRVANVFSQATQGVDGAFAVLAQIGIKFVDNSGVSDPLLANTLEIDNAILDDEGVARIEIKTAGQWYVRLIHMVESEEKDVDYESNWATLTFEVK